MTNVIKNWWWVGLIFLYFLGSTFKNNDTKSSSISSSTETVQYYKWKCRWCGNQIPIDQVLSPNEGIYTPQNGYAFCSQECWRAFRDKIILKIN